MARLLQEHDQTVAGVLLALWSLCLILAHWGTWSIDMSAVYMAGRFIALEEWSAVYAAPPDFFSKDIPLRWAEELAALGHPGEFPVPYVYPPLWATLASPLAGVTDPITFCDLSRVPMTLAFAATVFVAWRLMRPVGMSATVFTVVSIVIASLTIPFQFSVSLNQPQFLVVLLILLSFERYAAGRSVLAGGLLGLAAAIKISPIFLVLIFLSDRDWRATGAAILCAGGLMLLSFAVSGPGLHAAFLESLRHVQGLVPLIGFNMNFETLMYDFFVPLPDHPTSLNKLLGVDAPGVALANALLLPAAVALVFLATRQLEGATRLKLRLILLYTITVWLGPIAWMHYYTLPLLLAPALVGIWSPRAVIVTTALLTLGFSKVVMMGLVNWSLDRGEYTLFYPQHTALFPLAGFVIALLVWSARSSASETAPFPHRQPAE